MKGRLKKEDQKQRQQLSQIGFLIEKNLSNRYLVHDRTDRKKLDSNFYACTKVNFKKQDHPVVYNHLLLCVSGTST